MSQHNRSNPTFNFSSIHGPVYEQQPSYPFNDVYAPQQWLSPGLATAMSSAPSATSTARTYRNVPPKHALQRSHQRPAKIVQPNRNLDPRLQDAPQRLPPLDTRQPLANQHDFEPILHPLTLFYNQNEAPWNQFGMRNTQDSTAQNDLLQTQLYHGQHRRGPCSDVGSTVPASDSGYYTHQTPSVLSNEPGRVHQELPVGLLEQAKNLNVERAPVGSQAMARRPSDQQSVLSHHSSRSGGHRQLFRCREPGCIEVSKCASEQKKHMLKHEKNFICDEPDCKRAGKGFSTINDLDRHKKSVHRLGITKSKSYLCAASSCTNKGKLWPRLDNFKQHVERMHKNEDKLDLIKRSEHQASESPQEQQSISMNDPVLLAGMGDPHINLTSSSTHGFPYQSTMSFNASSMSESSVISPSPVSLDLSFSGFSRPPSVSDSAGLPSTSSLTLPVANTSTMPFGRRKSSKVSPTSMPSVTSAPSRGPVPQLQLSTAPQTKSEQQKQALAKLSKANINIEEIVQQILGAQQEQNGGARGGIMLSDIEKLHASQAIADLVKQKTKPTRLPQRRPTQGSATGNQQCTFEGCGFTGRTCDLNKHMKRHRKPYGCTYPKCTKVFGAKSDWKRHENSQHFQLEAFRCDLANKAGKECGQHYYRSKQFLEHLEGHHHITVEAQVESHLKRCRIGKNCQGQFWCGFCEKIVSLTTKRNAAWDERFDHIAHHFETGKKRIDTWLCVEENRTKGQLRDEMDRSHFADEDERDEDGEQELDDSEDYLLTHEEWPSAGDCQPPTHEAPKRRKTTTHYPEAQPPAQKPNQTILWNCCTCHDGPITHSLQLRCPECSHDFCDRCPRCYADEF